MGRKKKQEDTTKVEEIKEVVSSKENNDSIQESEVLKKIGRKRKIVSQISKIFSMKYSLFLKRMKQILMLKMLKKVQKQR